MKYLIAVTNPAPAQQIQAILRHLDPAQPSQVANTLHEAYHLTEHHEPAYVFLGPRMLQDESFAGLHALIRQLPTTLVVILPAGPTGPAIARAAATLKLPTLSAHLGPYVFRKGLEAVSGGNGAETGQRPRGRGSDRLILIGASTGGIDALQQVLASFDAGTPPVLVVQHTGRGFGEGVLRLLESSCRAEVLPATEGARLATGRVYLATDADRHLAIDQLGGLTCRLRAGERVSGHRPSIDVLFKSGVPIAPRVSAALLTGMGRDGAQGLLELRQAGAATFGQDRDSSVVYGMPRVAHEIGAVQRQLPPFLIGEALLGSGIERIGAA